MNLERNQRSVLAQLRAGILPLQIELGRFTNIKLADRICQLCNTQSIEDEYRFLFTCPAYENARNAFIGELDENFVALDNNNKLIVLFQFHTRKFAKFVCKILSIRQDALYNRLYLPE